MTEPVDAPAAPAVAPVPISEVGKGHNMPETTGLPSAVQDLVDAARGIGGDGPIVVPGTAPDAPAVPPAAPEAPAAPPAPPPAPEAVSFAQLAEQERTLRNRERALGVRQEEIRRREEAHQGNATSKDDRLAQLRQDPGAYLQREYGITLSQIAEYVAQGGGAARAGNETPEILELRQKIAAQEEWRKSIEQAQQQTVAQQQYQAAKQGLIQGLEGAKDTYPLLVGMLGTEKAAEAIVQGVTQSYSSGGYKSADEIAQELESNLRPIADRLTTVSKQPTAPKSPASPPQAPPRISNTSTASPATPPSRRSREDDIERAAESLRFVER